jgi:hypothetical protein
VVDQEREVEAGYPPEDHLEQQVLLEPPEGESHIDAAVVEPRHLGP